MVQINKSMININESMIEINDLMIKNHKSAKISTKITQNRDFDNYSPNCANFINSACDSLVLANLVLR